MDTRLARALVLRGRAHLSNSTSKKTPRALDHLGLDREGILRTDVAQDPNQREEQRGDDTPVIMLAITIERAWKPLRSCSIGPPITEGPRRMEGDAVRLDLRGMASPFGALSRHFD